MIGTRSITNTETGSQGEARLPEYQFTFDWFSHNISIWQKHLGPLAGRPNLRFLEVGSFEGRSAVWLLTNVLTHDTARIECIESFDGVWEWDSEIVDMEEVERRFDHNMRVTHAAHKVTKIKATSREALRKLSFEFYDLVYIDGSHMAGDVLEDAVLAFPLLKPGGILIFDDYLLERDHELTVPKSAIDAFLNVYRGRYEFLHRDYQVIIRKRFDGFAPGEIDSVTETSREVLEITLHELDGERLWGFNIEAPQAGSRGIGATLDVIGWVLGRSSPAVAMEFLSAGHVLQRVPLNVPRPDVAAYYPNATDASRSGFQTAINVAGVENDLLVQAVLLDESRIPIGIIRLRAAPDGTAVPSRGQDVYVPVGDATFGALRRKTPISSVFGFDRGVPIDRYYVENFLAREASSIQGRVLEIGDRSYTQKFGGNRVTTSDVLHIVEGNPQATIVGDLACAEHIPSDLFDCVILTQTLQCIYDVRAAVRTLYRILKPGGVVLATFPGITKISHRDWGYTWYWNFTALSARRLFEEVFPANDVKIEAQGNVLAAISLLHGLATEELRRDELEHHDPEYEVLLTAKAVKPQLPSTKNIGVIIRQPEVQQLNRSLKQRALILLYHRVAELASDPWSISVTPEHFAQHLEVLRSLANPIGLQQLVDNSSGTGLPDRPVVVTFDDGYLDNLENAKPLLEKYQTPATFFLVAGYLGNEREFWWDELERLFLQPGSLPETLHLEIGGKSYRWKLGAAAHFSEEDARQNYAWRAWEDAPSARHEIYRLLWQLLHPLAEEERRKVLKDLFAWAAIEPHGRPTHWPLTPQEACALVEGDLIEIGAHTMTHSALSGLAIAAQWDEIQQSKMHLESILHRPVNSFAYPFGRQCDYMPETVAVVRNVGFTCACSNFAGVVDQFSDRLQLPRIQIADWDRKDFAARLDQWFTASSFVSG